MSDAFRTSDDFDEQAHQLYNEGRYDEALAVLRDGLTLYPDAVDLHVGAGYAYLAREDMAWARRAFAQALVLDADHPDGLAGMGEALLRLGQPGSALEHFERTLHLGLQDDGDLMLQIGRALFREGLFVHAHRYFELGSIASPDLPDAAACLGYTCHRLGRDAEAFYWLRRALRVDGRYAEARIYLANALYDRGDNEAALHHLEQTVPEDHFDELGVWRVIELKKATYRLPEDDPELLPWFGRLAEISGDLDPVDALLGEVEALQGDGTTRDPNQLELFSALLTDLQAMHRRPGSGEGHIVTTLSGHTLRGSWDEILSQLWRTEAASLHRTLAEFMRETADRGRTETGTKIPVTDAESFLRASATAGVLRILQ